MFKKKKNSMTEEKDPGMNYEAKNVKTKAKPSKEEIEKRKKREEYLLHHHKTLKDSRFHFNKYSKITIPSGLSILAINFFILSSYTQFFTMINFVAGLMILGVPLVTTYREFSSKKEIESNFPVFLQDLTQGIKTGMTLPQAIKSATNNDYGSLSSHVSEISAKISWGIPFERVLTDFANKTHSEGISRTVQTVIQTHSSGGKMDVVLENSAKSLQQLEKIKKERSVSVYSQMINGYLIYVIFLGVMIGLSIFLLPAFQFSGSSANTADIAGLFDEIFLVLVIIQGVFAGLAIGKMAEGTMLAGIKHSMVLTTLGLSVILFFT